MDSTPYENKMAVGIHMALAGEHPRDPIEPRRSLVDFQTCGMPVMRIWETRRWYGSCELPAGHAGRCA